MRQKYFEQQRKRGKIHSLSQNIAFNIHQFLFEIQRDRQGCMQFIE